MPLRIHVAPGTHFSRAAKARSLSAGEALHSNGTSEAADAPREKAVAVVDRPFSQDADAASHGTKAPPDHIRAMSNLEARAETASTPATSAATGSYIQTKPVYLVWTRTADHSGKGGLNSFWRPTCMPLETVPIKPPASASTLTILA
jgi:hypothetical protein